MNSLCTRWALRSAGTCSDDLLAFSTGIFGEDGVSQMLCVLRLDLCV